MLWVKILSVLGSYASLVALLLSMKAAGTPLTGLQGTVVGAAGVLCIIAVVFTVSDDIAKRPKQFKNNEQIKNYMYKWISHQGRTAVFTRDMSWSNDDRIRDLLFSKARHGDLSVYLPEATEFAEELREEGAHVYDYPELEYIPASRFTIINFGRSDAHVAVGGRVNGKHVIREFRSGEHPFFSIANDLVEVIKRMNRCRQGDISGSH